MDYLVRIFSAAWAFATDFHGIHAWAYWSFILAAACLRYRSQKVKQ